MTPRAPRVVVFDLGNVLITWDRRLLYRTIFDDVDAMERFLEDVYTLRVNERLDRGEPLAELVASLAAEHPAYASEIAALRDRWIETIGPVIDGTIDILDELRDAGVRCFALSNWNGDTFALVAPRYQFLDWFDGIVLSGHEGYAKPEPELFLCLCERHGFAPHDAVFVDDSPANVDAARALGMDAIVFTTPEHLRDELVARGLLPVTNG